MANRRRSGVLQLGMGMITVLIANIINMVFNLLINFIQPKYLPVDSYAAVKTFTLYLTASGLFHLGYEDGTYLKYGGKLIQDINKNEINANVATLRVFQLVMMTLSFIVGVILDDIVVKIFALMLLPYNMTMHFKLFYQATGEFGLYGRIMNSATIFSFIGNIILIFLFKKTELQWYLMLQVLIYAFIWIILEVRLRKGLCPKSKILLFSMPQFVRNISSGFFIMIGNFSSIFLTSMDRWFVKGLLLTTDFASYSFAVSMEGFITVAISPFTVTLYNFFCQEQRIEQIKKMHNYILLFASLLASLAFPIKFILEIWLVDYLESTIVLFYLFGSQILFIIIKSIYVNLYKARQENGRYFIKLLIVLISGAVFNALCFLVWHVKEAMALGTFLSSVLWFALCQSDFKEIKYDWRHFSYLGISVVSFMILGNGFHAQTGFISYIAILFISAGIFVRKDLAEIMKLAKRILQRRKAI